MGLRIRAGRFDAGAKLSQNKQPDVGENVIEHLEPRNPASAHRRPQRDPDRDRKGIPHSEPGEGKLEGHTGDRRASADDQRG